VTIRIGKLPVNVPGATRTLFEARSGRLVQATILLRPDLLHPDWGVGDRSATVVADSRATGGPFSITDAGVPGDGQYCYAVVVLDAWQHPSRLATAWYTRVSPPAAAFSWSPDTGNAHRVAFTDGSTDAGGRIVSWRWDFGDGGSSTDQNPAHIYASGTYTVTLTVTDDRGQTATASQRVTVAG
jgi:PKD repeat protein